MSDDAIEEVEEKVQLISKIVSHLVDPKVLPWILMLFMTNIGQAFISKFTGVDLNEENKCIVAVEKNTTILNEIKGLCIKE